MACDGWFLMLKYCIIFFRFKQTAPCTCKNNWNKWVFVLEKCSLVGFSLFRRQWALCSPRRNEPPWTKQVPPFNARFSPWNIWLLRMLSVPLPALWRAIRTARIAFSVFLSRLVCAAESTRRSGCFSTSDSVWIGLWTKRRLNSTE